MSSRTRPSTPHHDTMTIQPYEPTADIHIDSSHPTYQPRPHVSYIPARRSNPLGLHLNGTPSMSEAGPSNAPMGSPIEISSPRGPSRHLLGGYSVEGGWQPDGRGGFRHVPHGRIEEVDDNDIDTNPQRLASNAPLGYSGSMEITEPLPPATTPPPRPMHRQVNRLMTSANASMRGISAQSASALSPLTFTSPALDRVQETDLLAINLRSVDIAIACADSLSLVFTTVNHLFDIRANVNSCERIKKSLLAMRTALNRRSRFSDDQLRLGTPKWHQRYMERLASLERTLQKFCSFEYYVRTHQLVLKLMEKSLDKLQEYVSKFSNLELKFNASFDRLRVRHIHAKLIEAHEEAQRIRNIPHCNKVLFQSRWTEGKALRANLRYDYHAYRNGRRTSLMT